MRKHIKNLNFLLLVSIIVLAGCAKKFDNPVDQTSTAYSIGYIKPMPQTVFAKDTTIDLVAEITSANKPANIFVELVDSYQVVLSSTMQEVGLYFTGTLKFSETVSVGNYDINYYIIDSNGEKVILAKQYVTVKKWNNSAPVITEVVAADTLTVSATATDVILKAKVTDADGLSDISKVYYSVVKPDNSTVGPFDLLDDGFNYDQAANDGTYTSAVTMYSDAIKGTYRFDFQAKDKSNAVSTIKSHYITIK